MVRIILEKDNLCGRNYLVFAFLFHEFDSKPTFFKKNESIKIAALF